MVSGLNMYFQQPIAYYFHTTLKADDRAELITQLLSELCKHGVKVSSVTFDGYSSNAKMSNILGANFKSESGNYTTHFTHPSDGSKVCIMYDPSHMEKLIRNTLGTVKTLYSGRKKIQWKYFESLVECNRLNNLGLASKMNKRHIEFANRKMHVRTAVETLSSTTADTMEFLMKNGVPEFAGAEGTIEFTRKFDRLWDVMNTHRIRLDTSNVFKSALNAKNAGEVFQFLDEAKTYIVSLALRAPKSGKLIKLINSNYRTGFRGFLISINSLRHMYYEFVEKQHWLLFFATYRISQDHLEILFGKIRSMNGSNDNPLPHQFRSAYRKILHQCEIAHSPNANIRALASASSHSTTLVASNILTVPSTRQRRSNLIEDVAQDISQPHIPPISNAVDVDESFEETYEFELIMDHNFLSDSTNNSGIAYIANSIEQKFFNASQIYCTACIDVLKSNVKVDEKLCINPNLGRPCVSTYQICKLADIQLKTLINTGPNFKQTIYHNIITSLPYNKVFPNFKQHEHDFEHKRFLIKFIIDDYVNRKCNYVAKQKTMDTQKQYIRNKLRKLCHYYNQ